MHFTFEVLMLSLKYPNSYSPSTSSSQNLSIKIYLSLDKSLSKMEKVGRKIKRKLKVKIWFKKNILNNKASCFLPRVLVYLSSPFIDYIFSLFVSLFFLIYIHYYWATDFLKQIFTSNLSFSSSFFYFLKQKSILKKQTLSLKILYSLYS